MGNFINIFTKTFNLTMGGGSSESSMNANGQVAFNPTSIGGGNIAVGGSVGNGGVNQQGSNSATGAGVKLDLSMPFPMQLQNLGWEQDVGDATSDVAKMGADAYQMYQANQPVVDALWKMMDPKGHEAHSKEVFGTINQIDQMGTAMGGWNTM